MIGKELNLYNSVVKRREAKSKGEKERYKHLNAEFQRIARRDKKSFLSDQCKYWKEWVLGRHLTLNDLRTSQAARW